jgi:hypothetical protein
MDAQDLDLGICSKGEENFQLTWKGTFIEADADDNESDLSPRASSDPGSVSSGYSSHFRAEYAYVSSLSSRIAKWPGPATSNSDYSETAKGSKSDTATPERSSPNGIVDKCSTKQIDIASTSASSGFCDPDTKVGRKLPTIQKMQLHRDELKVHMRKKAETTDQRLCVALTSIQEIPEQVNEVFQQTATDLVDEVTNEVTKARKLLVEKVDDPETSTEVASQVQEIPDMVMASFEVSFAKAMSHVRVRVEDVIQTLERSDLQNDEVAGFLSSIPEEVRQITRDAVYEASVASQDAVNLQLDNVLQNISDEQKTAAVFRAKQNIVHSLPQTLPETVRRSGEVAKYNIQNATEVVVEKGMGDCGYVANRVVADTLLRAKVGDALDDPDLPGEVLTNPGSRGHPELCSRACLYYGIGKCTNGMNCAFCHAPHSKRTTHLDKRHREMMRSMHFMDRFCLILPILKSKLDALDKCDLDVKSALSSIWKALSQDRDLLTDKRKAKETRSLQSSLKFMSARSLVALLYHSPIPPDSPHYEAIGDFFKTVRPSLSSGHVKLQSSTFTDLTSRMSEPDAEF